MDGFGGPSSSGNTYIGTEATLPYIRFPHTFVVMGDGPTPSDGIAGGGDAWPNAWAATADAEYIPLLEAFENAQRGVGGSPYENVVAYDSRPDFDGVSGKLDAVESASQDLGPTALLADAFSFAVSAYDDKISGGAIDQDAVVDDAIDAAELHGRGRFLKDASRAASAWEDLGCVNNTQFSLAQSNLEGDWRGELTKREASLRLYQARERTDTVLRLANFYLQQKQSEVRSLHDLFLAEMALAKTTTVARIDQQAMDLSYEVKDALWDLELYPYMSNAIVSINGATVIPPSQSRAERMLASINQSASMGLQMYTATGSWELAAGSAALNIAGGMWVYGD